MRSQVQAALTAESQLAILLKRQTRLVEHVDDADRVNDALLRQVRVINDAVTAMPDSGYSGTVSGPYHAWRPRWHVDAMIRSVYSYDDMAETRSNSSSSSTLTKGTKSPASAHDCV